MGKIDQARKRKINNAINLIEELSWLLDSKRSMSLNDVPSLLRSLLEESNDYISSNEIYSLPNPNKNHLVGILPKLFLDEDLFKTNNDVADFAKDVLNVRVPRIGKRSKYELIGLIVCEVTKLNDNDLSVLVESLSRIINSSDKLQQIKEAKKSSNFSWNDAIQRLSQLP